MPSATLHFATRDDLDMITHDFTRKVTDSAQRLADELMAAATT